MKSKWNSKTPGEKALLLFRIVISAAIVVFALLQLFEVWNKALYIAVPLMGVNSLLISVQEWKQSRISAIVSLCVAVFVFACTAVVWFAK